MGSPRDVARSIDAVFGPRIAKRHELIRRSLGSEEAAAKLFEASGLTQRPKPVGTASISPLALLAAISPPAPSERYSFGKATPDYGSLAEKKTRRNLAAGVFAGLAVGAIATLLLAVRSPKGRAVVSAEAVAALSGTPASPIASEARRVVVPLPFLASHVELDGLGKDLDPAADVAVFEVPRESGVVHPVAAIALDGTRAEAYVREADGVARVEGDGFLFILPPVSPSSLPRARPPRPATGPRPTAPGKVKNGFTKLP